MDRRGMFGLLAKALGAVGLTGLASRYGEAKMAEKPDFWKVWSGRHELDEARHISVSIVTGRSSYHLNGTCKPVAEFRMGGKKLGFIDADECREILAALESLPSYSDGSKTWEMFDSVHDCSGHRRMRRWPPSNVAMPPVLVKNLG